MFNKKIGLAPMADYTDYAYRKICRDNGADFVFTEMISSDALIREHEKTSSMLPKKTETNIGIQLFGNNPDVFSEAGLLVENFCDWIDINAACPVNKVVKKGAGSGLLLNLENLSNIIYSLKKTVKIPVGVKVRLGFENIEIFKILGTVEKAGADYIIVHGRTREQLYSGQSNKKIFKDIRAFSKITLGASGDVYSKEDIKEYFEKYGVDFVIAARGSFGNPWIFSDKIPQIDDIIDTCFEHLKIMIEDYNNEKYAVTRFRKILMHYFKGYEGAKEIRRNLHTLENFEDVKLLIDRVIIGK
jgi:nifR3 family TIM-barrel protein